MGLLARLVIEILFIGANCLDSLDLYLAFISEFAQELSSIGNELRKRIETEKREIERLNVRIFRFDFR